MNKPLQERLPQQAFAARRTQKHAIEAQQASSTYSGQPARWVRSMARMLSALFILENAAVLSPAYAQSAHADLPIIPGAGAPAGQRPIMDVANNGVPIVLIAPPSAGGVSRNQYEQFNVNPNGLILNNSSGNTPTRQGGWIAGNPQLGVTPARIILNEVISGNPSNLRGTIEVAGHRADIVVANPNGIACNGCAFLNAGRASLAAGAPQFGYGGALSGFDVRQGKLTIGGRGLNASSLEQLDLIARGIVIEGDVWAQTLNVITGANQTLYGTLHSAAQSGNGTAPGFAIDIKDVGGMYANQIYLLATEQGLGVNSAGRMAALQGNLVLSVNGDLLLQDSYAKRNIRIDSTGALRLAGLTQSEGTSTIITAGKLSNQGTIDVQDELAVSAGTVHNSGIMAQRGMQHAVIAASGDVVNTGMLYSATRFSIDADTVRNLAGRIVAGQAVAMQAANVNNADGEIMAGNGITFAGTGTIDNTRGEIISDGNLDLVASSLNNISGTVRAKQTAGVRLGAGFLDNTQGEVIGTQALLIQSGEIRNSAGTIASGSTLFLDTQGAALTNNNSGQIVANDDLIIASARFDNAAGTAVSIDGNLHVATGNRQLVNDEGKLQAAGNTTVAAGNMSNRNGLISGHDVAVRTGALDNGGGEITAGGTLAIAAAGLNNNAGFVGGNAGLAVTLAGDLDNRAANGQAGQMVSNADLSITAANVFNPGGRIDTLGNASIAAALLDNRSGTIAAAGTAQLNVTALDNRAQNGVAGSIDATNINAAANVIANQGGTLRGANDSIFTANSIDNTGGTITAGSNLALAAAGITNAGGRMVGDHSVTIGTSSRTLGGTIASSNSVSLHINGDYSNTGLLSSQKDLTVNAANIDNSGTFKAGETLTANTGNLTNSGEFGGRSVVLNASGVLSNLADGLIDGTDTRINAGTINNAGRIYGGWLGVHAGTVNNSDTGAIAARNILLIGAQALNNTDGGLIYSLGDIGIGGSLDAADRLRGSMQNLTNASSRIEAARDMAITSDGLLNRNDGLTTALVSGAPVYRQEVQPNGSATRYPVSLCSGIGGAQDSNGCIVHPDRYGLRSALTPVYTHTYVFDPETWQTTLTDTQVNYPWNASVFSQFEVAPVGVPPPAEPAGGCSYFDSYNSAEIIINSPACSQWRSDYATWDTAFLATLTELDAKINIYNAEVNEDNRIDQFEDYTWYKMASTETRTQIATTAPAQILSGGSMSIVGSVTNQDSQIVAGNALAIAGPAVANIATKGEHRTDFSGTAEFTEVVSCGTFGRRHCRNWYGASPYNPAPISIMVDLPTVRYESFAGDQTIARSLAVATGSVDTSIADAVLAAGGNSRDLPGYSVQAVMAGSGPFSVTVPDNKLFVIRPEPSAPYLIETDPRFINQSSFLGSDYFLQILNRDPERQLKRYGDGFAEQKLVNDQILAITGRRYLTGYSNTEDEFKALMEAGAAYAREFQISPGVALSAEQMALLTTDIVLLVTGTVALPDGMHQQVLVPQVYLRRPTDEDLQPTGSLIAAGDVLIKTDRDLVNSGTVTGNTVTALAGNDLANQGGRISGQNVMMRAGNDLKNLSGVIAGTGQNANIALLAGRDIVLQTLTGQSRNMDGSSTRTSVQRIATVQGAGVHLEAGRDLANQGAVINAQQNLAATAVRDVLITTVDGQYQLEIKDGGGRATQGRTAHIKEAAIAHQSSLLKAGGDIAVIAGGDIKVKGSHIDAGSADAGDLLLQGQNISIEAVRGRMATDVQTIGAKSYNRVARDNERLVIGAATASQNISIRGIGAAADESGNITFTGANISAQHGQVALTANNDITIRNDSVRHKAADESYSKSGNAFTTITTTKSSDRSVTLAEGSSVSGNTITARAGRNLAIQGSAIVGDSTVVLDATENVSIAAATSASAEKGFTKVQENGFLSGGGFGISYGQRITTTELDRDGATQSGQQRSLVGTSAGDLAVTAGTALQVSGSDLAAGRDMSLTGQSVTIDAGRDIENTKLVTRMEQDALTIAIGGSVVNVVQKMQTLGEAASKAKNSRVKAMAAATAAMAAADAAKEIAANGANVSISLTAGRSESEQTQTYANSDSTGSTVAAGRDLNIAATGAGRDSNLTVIGSDLSAGSNVTLVADNQINLQAAQDTEAQHSQSKSMSAAAGIAASVGTSGMAFGFNASASMGGAREDGDGVTQRNTHVNAGNVLSIQSGGDTNLKGAVASGKQVIADIRGDLNIESLQDTAWFDSKSQSASINATVGFGASVSASFNRSKIKSDYASVQEQSGILAGDGGFDIAVKGNTDLKGAVIASSQAAIDDNSNRLSTATLTESVIQNHSIADTDSMGVSASASFGGGDAKDSGKGKGPGGTNLINAGNGPNITDGKYEAGKAVIGNLLNNSTESRSSSGVTRSAISAGIVIIANDQAQQASTGKTAAETIAGLNRDIATANTVVQKQDVQEMAQAAEGEREIKQAVFVAATKFADESYRKAFLEKHPIYEIVRDEEGKTQFNEKTGKPLLRELLAHEKTNLKPGPNGKVHIAANGIFNDKYAAGSYANQHGATEGPQYLIYFPEADNVISELMVAGYQKFLESDALGLSSSTSQVRDIMNQYGQVGLQLDGHSRGAMTIGNALESQAGSPDSQGSLSQTTVHFFGPAYNAQQADSLLSTLQDRQRLPVTQQPTTVLQFQNHIADPVGSWIGQNPATGGTIPEGSSVVKEALHAIGGENTVHNCYGAPGAKPCQQFWNSSSTGQRLLQPIRTRPVLPSKE